MLSIFVVYEIDEVKMVSELQGKLLSAKESVLRLGISKPTLSRLCRDKKIGYYRVGTRILFSEEKHIIPFLDSVEHKPVTSAGGGIQERSTVLASCSGKTRRAV